MKCDRFLKVHLFRVVSQLMCICNKSKMFKVVLYSYMCVPLQTSLHRQRHTQEDDPVSRWPLLKDTEDPNSAHGRQRPRIPEKWDDKGKKKKWIHFTQQRDSSLVRDWWIFCRFHINAEMQWVFRGCLYHNLNPP